MKKTRWYKLNIVLPALLVVPPLGFFLLWMSPRSRKFKTTLSVVVVLLFAAAAGVMWQTEYYKNFMPQSVPASGFDVERDGRGHYRIDRVLPFERQIFNEVVEEMRRLQKEQGPSYSQTEARAMEDPETKAVDIVAVRNSLDGSEVEAIFMKVSSKMSRQY